MKRYIPKQTKGFHSFVIIPMVLFSLSIFGCSKNSVTEPDPPYNKANVIYVASDGSDSNSGSVNAPLHGICKALDKAIPGDTVIVRGGDYYEKVSFPKSGMEGKCITLKAYPRETPVINGTSLTINGKEALVTFRNARYIVFEGFDVCNYKSTTPWVNINGILVTEGSCNITIRRNKIYNIEHNVKPEDGRSGHGIEIIGNTAEVIRNILVEENEIHDCNTGYSENLTINGYVDNFTIRKNKIYNGENIGIDAAGGYSANNVPEHNYARNGTICDNEIYNIDMTTGPIGKASGTNDGHGAIGIYIDGARNIVVDRNKVYDTDRGIGIVSENDAYPTEGCFVRNNFIYNCWHTGIYLGGYLNYTTGGTNNCYVINNTLAFNDKSFGAFGEVEGEIRLTENCKNNIIKNNIVYARAENDLFIHKYTTSGSNNIIDYNLYYSVGTPKWLWNSVNGTGSSNFSDWQTTSGGDLHSTYGIDPQFKSVSIPDLHIQESSPAKDSGQIISSDIHGQTDIDNQPRIVNNKISKGAHQIQ